MFNLTAIEAPGRALLHRQGKFLSRPGTPQKEVRLFPALRPQPADRQIGNKLFRLLANAQARPGGIAKSWLRERRSRIVVKGKKMAIPVLPINARIPELAIRTPNTFNLVGFNLQAGVTYQFAAFGRDDGGGTLANPDMALANTNGQGNPVQALAYSDNTILSHDPVILFTPKISGQYDIIVGGRGTVGTYDLHANIFGGPLTFGSPVG